MPKIVFGQATAEPVSQNAGDYVGEDPRWCSTPTIHQIVEHGKVRNQVFYASTWMARELRALWYDWFCRRSILSFRRAEWGLSPGCCVVCRWHLVSRVLPPWFLSTTVSEKRVFSRSGGPGAVFSNTKSSFFVESFVEVLFPPGGASGFGHMGYVVGHAIEERLPV